MVHIEIVLFWNVWISDIAYQRFCEFQVVNNEVFFLSYLYIYRTQIFQKFVTSTAYIYIHAHGRSFFW